MILGIYFLIPTPQYEVKFLSEDAAKNTAPKTSRQCNINTLAIKTKTGIVVAVDGKNVELTAADLPTCAK